MNRPMPRVEVDLAPWAPGWALRAVAALMTGLAPLLAILGSPAMPGYRAFLAAAAVAFCLWAAWRPGHAPGLAGAGLTAFLVVITPPGDGVPAALWLAPLAYLGVRLCAWAAATGLTARVELAALARSARIDAIVVGSTVLLGAVAAVLDGSTFAGLAVGAIALLGLVILVRRTEDGTP